MRESTYARSTQAPGPTPEPADERTSGETASPKCQSAPPGEGQRNQTNELDYYKPRGARPQKFSSGNGGISGKSGIGRISSIRKIIRVMVNAGDRPA